MESLTNDKRLLVKNEIEAKKNLNNFAISTFLRVIVLVSFLQNFFLRE